ncbi:UDP-glucose glycoprotein glucosyltransferase [Ceratocystis lukuohia]|uniref:UDP-glucose glycoprotein glucosyltransferase n=1 Tax=Ceratocystis lukuohia TaxID=2019550 RepID=A0ABR4MQJ4_9PEZI
MRQLGIVAALLAALPASAVPAVDISMQAAFPSPPYLLELIETAAGENATAYYPILDKVANGYFNGISSDKDLYDAFLRLLSEDGYVTSPDMLSTFNFALSMRTAAPRVEAHYQYYATGIEPHLGSRASDKDCNVWALIDDKGTTIKGLQATNLPFDRILGAGVPAVLYADISDPAFAPFHKAMVAAARKGEVSYRLRHRRTASHGTPEPLPVNGYGVELSLKRTDYIVIDDRETGDQPAVKDTTDDLQVVLNDDEEVADLKPLSKAELLNLGLSTTSYIMQSPNPFDTLVKVSQDFPKYSAKLAAHEIASEILEKRPKRDVNTPAGRNMMWINGVQQIERQIEPFNLLEALRRERKLIQGVRSLGLNARQANALLGHNAITGSKISEDSIRYDWRDNLEGNRVIMWMNDLEKDPGYAQFDRSVKALLRQNFGQIPPSPETSST